MPSAPVHFAVMVCTRDRPKCITGALRALAGLEAVAGGSIAIVVADNNPQSQEAFIRDAATAAGVAIAYVHEPRRGYSSIRNAAIRTALTTPADTLVFVDDDWRVSPDLVKVYADAFVAHDASVLQGNTVEVSGRARRTSGDGAAVRKAVGTYNVAFRRWLAEDAGVRFDPRLDLVGFEDREFFLACRRSGAKAIYANRAVVRAPPPEEIDRAAERDLPTFAEAAACNKIAVETMLHGRLSALGIYLASYAARGVAGRALLALGLRRGRVGREADLMVRKHRGAWTGLMRGHGYDRAAARRGELIAVRLDAGGT